MRGAFGVMAAAAAAVAVAAWRRVHRDGVDVRLAERAARSGLEAPSMAPSRPPAGAGRRLPAGQRLERAEPAESIRIVRRSMEPADTIRIVRRSAAPPEPTRAEPVRAEPAAVQPARAHAPEPVQPEPPFPAEASEPVRTGASEPVQAEPPFPAEAPERGREEPPVPPAAWRGGSAPGPARVPRPMYWPAFLALGAVWAVWGSISTPLLIFGGLAVFGAALVLWIREMIHAG